MLLLVQYFLWLTLQIVQQLLQRLLLPRRVSILWIQEPSNSQLLLRLWPNGVLLDVLILISLTIIDLILVNM